MKVGIPKSLGQKGEKPPKKCKKSNSAPLYITNRISVEHNPEDEVLSTASFAQPGVYTQPFGSQWNACTTSIVNASTFPAVPNAWSGIPNHCNSYMPYGPYNYLLLLLLQEMVISVISTALEYIYTY